MGMGKQTRVSEEHLDNDLYQEKKPLASALSALRPRLPFFFMARASRLATRPAKSP